MCGVLFSLFQFLVYELLCQRKDYKPCLASASTCYWKRNLSPIIISLMLFVILFPFISLNTDINIVKIQQNLGSSASDFFSLFWGRF